MSSCSAFPVFLLPDDCLFPFPSHELDDLASVGGPVDYRRVYDPGYGYPLFTRV